MPGLPVLPFNCQILMGMWPRKETRRVMMMRMLMMMEEKEMMTNSGFPLRKSLSGSEMAALERRQNELCTEVLMVSETKAMMCSVC